MHLGPVITHPGPQATLTVTHRLGAGLGAREAIMKPASPTQVGVCIDGYNLYYATRCGAAGTYSLLRPSDSRRILDSKLDQIEAAGVDFVVAVNPAASTSFKPGCASAVLESRPSTSPNCSSRRCRMAFLGDRNLLSSVGPG